MAIAAGASVWERLAALGEHRVDVTQEDVLQIISLLPAAFKNHLVSHGIPERKAQALVTKFRDAGRRSAPWKPVSSRVPGRPQDGADGNRINRWLLPEDHKFHADERNATLVEVKYFLQVLSMRGAPEVPNARFRAAWRWLIGHDVVPGAYLDPVKLVEVDFQNVIVEPRIITSGHLVPLDRGGRHVPQNTFLMLKESNDLQGNKTLNELLVLIEGIVTRHVANGTFPD